MAPPIPLLGIVVLTWLMVGLNAELLAAAEAFLEGTAGAQMVS